MKPKLSKYDTNPLDPEVARRTEEVWGQEDAAPATETLKGMTSRVGSAGAESPRANAYSEAPTRRYDAQTPLDAPYQSVFAKPPAPTAPPYSPPYAPPAIYQPPPQPYRPPAPQHMARTVEGLGIPEKWAVVLPYAPYIGVVAAIIELLVVTRREVRVRGHAAQALALHLALIAIQILFSGLSLITGSSAGGTLFSFAAFVFLIVSMVRVAKGETHRIAPLAEPAQWLDTHIDSRK